MSLFIHTVWSTLSLVGSGEHDRLSGPLDSSRFLLASANCPCYNCMTMRGFPGIIFLCISRFITHFTLCLMESCSFFFLFSHIFMQTLHNVSWELNQCELSGACLWCCKQHIEWRVDAPDETNNNTMFFSPTSLVVKLSPPCTREPSRPLMNCTNGAFRVC